MPIKTTVFRSVLSFFLMFLAVSVMAETDAAAAKQDPGSASYQIGPGDVLKYFCMERRGYAIRGAGYT